MCDPGSVSFGVHPTNDFAFCDTNTSLSSAVSTSRAEKAIENDKQTAALTLKIDADNLNANKLGKAYNQTNGESSIVLCVRARVKKDGKEILYTEHNVKVTYSMRAQISITPKIVNPYINNKEVTDIGTMSKKNTAYQCDKQYKEIEKPEPLSPHSNVLRVCIEGESNAFKCENIVSATLKQEDKADKKLITDGESSGEFITQSSKEQICMLTALVLPEYFVKKSATDKVCT